MKIRTDPRTGIKFADYVIAGRRHRVSLGTKNGEIAIIKASRIADNKKVRDLGKLPFEGFLDRYRQHLKATRTKQTLEIFETALRKLLNFKTITELSEVTPVLLDDLQVSLKNHGAGNAGINRSTRALRTAMKQAEYWGLIQPQDWQKINRFRENKKRLEFHSPEEIKKILSVCPSEGWRLVVLLGARAGLRRGEMSNLKWQDVNLSKHQLYIAPNKTEEDRYVPIAPDLCDALRIAKEHAKSEYVINVGGNGSRGSKDFITAYYSKFTSKLPFHCHVHKLRHTFASQLVQNGADLYHVSKLMGHSSIKMTEIYAHLAPHALEDTIKMLPKI